MSITVEQSIIRDNILSCGKCGLRATCKSPVPGTGDLSTAQYMLIGEATGWQEDRFGKPFTGRIGRELDANLEYNYLHRKNAYLTNVNKCKAGEDEEITEDQIEACKEHLYNEIALFRGNIIGTLGSVAARVIIGNNFDLEKAHGIPVEVNIGGKSFVAFPMLHPSLGFHKPASMVQIHEDFERFGKFIRGEIKLEDFKDKYPNPKYGLAFGLLVRDLFVQNFNISGNIFTLPTPNPYIYLDTETCSDYKSPWSIQVSTSPGSANFIFAEDKQALEILKEACEKHPIVLHNAKYDLRVLNKLGIYPSKVYDNMVAAYLLQNLPQGLKKLAYRLAGVEMVSFKSLVHDKSQAKFKSYFEEILRHEWPQPPKVKEWRKEPKYEFKQELKYIPCTKRTKTASPCHFCSYLPNPFSHCPACQGKGFYKAELKKGEKVIVPGTENGYWHEKQPQEIPQLINRALNEYKKNPNSINLVDRWFNFDKSTRDLIESKLGKLFEADLRDVDFNTALTYACRDADVTGRTWLPMEAELRRLGLWDVFEVDMACLPMFMEMEDTGFKIIPEKFQELATYYNGELETLQKEIDEVAGYHVELASSDQVAEFLYTKLNIKCPKYTKKQAESTDKEALKEIEDAHPIISKILSWRMYEKNRSSFAENIPKMVNPKTNRLHGEIKVTRTITGRPAMAEPNLLQIPKRTKEGEKIRLCFTCDEGHTLISADYSQIELRVMAHVAKDRKMIKCFTDNIDLHSFTGSNIFGVPIDVIESSKDNKKQYRDPAKTINFGIPYGFTPEGLLKEFETMGLKGWTLDKVKEFMKEWFKLFPDTKDYFSEKKAEARRLGYVTDIFGRIYRIPHVRSTAQYVVDAGDRLAGNYPIQGGAQGIIKRAMRNLIPIYKSFQRIGKYCSPVVQIYDDLIFEIDESIVESFAPIFQYTMENAVSLLVPLKAEPSIGRIWGAMEDYKPKKT